MKKKLLFFLSAGFLMLLAACSTPEADEVLDYHNDAVDYINPKQEEANEYFVETQSAESDEEAYEIVKNDVAPVVEDMKDYFDDQSPEEDITKEYHELQSKGADSYYESVQTQIEAYEAFLDGSEGESDELFDEAEEQMEESNDYDEQAQEKWKEIMDKYKFEEEDE